MLAGLRANGSPAWQSALPRWQSKLQRLPLPIPTTFSVCGQVLQWTQRPLYDMAWGHSEIIRTTIYWNSRREISMLCNHYGGGNGYGAV